MNNTILPHWLNRWLVLTKAFGLWLIGLPRQLKQKITAFKQAPHQLDQALLAPLQQSRWPSLKQWRYLPQLLSTKEKRLFGVAFLVMILAVVALTVRFVDRHLVAGPGTGGSYTEAVVGQPNFINPLLAVTPVEQDLTALTYSGLLTWNNQGQLAPDLAESWSVSEDGKQYAFKLRENLIWQDGQPLTTKDIAFTINLIGNDQVKTALKPVYAGVEVAINDDRTIIFHLPKPLASWPTALTRGFLPAHLWEKVPPDQLVNSDLNKQPVGSGPWQITSVTRNLDGDIVGHQLKRWSDYPQPAFIKEVALKHYDTMEEAIQAWRDNKVDGVATPAAHLKELLGVNGQILVLPLPQYVALFLNPLQQLALNDQDLREVLLGVLDKEKIAKLFPEREVTLAPNWAAPSLKTLDEANKALNNLSWNKTASGLRAKNGQALAITLVSNDNLELTTVAKYIEETWKELGVKVDLRLVDPTSLAKDYIKERNYSAILVGQNYGLLPDPFPFWSGTEIASPGLNLSSISDKNTDRLVNELRMEQDPDRRTVRFAEFQKSVGNRWPGLVLYDSRYLYALDPTVKGLTKTALNSPADRWHLVKNWYRSTSWRWKW